VIENIYLRVLAGGFFIILGLILLIIFFNRKKTSILGEVYRNSEELGDYWEKNIPGFFSSGGHGFLFGGIFLVIAGFITLFFG
jgi:hypothetical protein